MNGFDSDFLHAAVRHVPLFLACVLGLIFACIWWRRHPLSAGLVLTGTLLFAGGLSLYLFWEFAWFPELDANNDVPEGLDELILYGTPFLQAIGLALVISAAFVGRRDQRSRRPFFEED